MVLVKDIARVIEEYAPLSAQESYDNSGLIVGDPDAKVASALLCVDITEAVMEEAKWLGVGMVISHHPVVFHGLKHITGGTYIERVVAQAIKSDIALYACHTNLDSVPGGLSHRLADMLGLKNTSLLAPSRPLDPTVGFGVVGEVKGIKPVDFLNLVKEKLAVKAIRHSDINREAIKKVAVCSGSGSSLMSTAKSAGADIYLAADFKYNDFLDADRDIIIADIGHFESEYCAIDALYDIIIKKIPTFALHKSKNSRNPVNYLY